jgi:ribonucleoside-diphosphate reductase beta chain
MKDLINLTNLDFTKETIFFGSGLGLQRYDVFKYKKFEEFTKRQLSYFWIPDEIELGKDKSDFVRMNEAEQHIFTSNLKYQILLDSVQGRGILGALTPYISLPEFESCCNVWQFFENIHSRSYTHIIKNIYPNPTEVFDSILDNEAILKRANTVCDEYNHIFSNTSITKEDIYLLLISINILEGMRFYVSFACSFAFAELDKMVKSAKIMQQISRDESIHLQITQYVINILSSDDSDFETIIQDNKDKVLGMYLTAAEQEIEWAEYLFQYGAILGLNTEILTQYIQWLTNNRLTAIKLPKLFEASNKNPLPWMNNWLNSDKKQVAPQESEVTSYLIGGINKNQEFNLDSFTL